MSIYRLQFDLSLISKYRTQLMGLAALMVILCHAPVYGVVMPHILQNIVGRLNLGVDIFLLLSGVGCYYSLSKGYRLKQWYGRRFIRIVIPYVLMQIPFWIYRLIVGEFDISNEMMIFSTLSFWTRHIGAWYIALLIPLYLFTPLIFVFFKKNTTLRSLMLILILLIVCSVSIKAFEGTFYEVLRNLQGAFVRVISFIIGMTIAPCVMKGMKVSSLLLFVSAFGLYCGIHAIIGKDIFMGWCLVWPVIIISIYLISRLAVNGILFKFISWMGVVSLESYLANIYLCETIKDIVSRIGYFSILYGHYLEYLCAIIAGIVFSSCINSITKKVTEKFSI